MIQTNLLTLPHLFFPTEITIKAFAMFSSHVLRVPMDPMLPKWPYLNDVSPSFWEPGMSSSLVNGSCLFRSWTYHTGVTLKYNQKSVVPLILFRPLSLALPCHLSLYPTLPYVTSASLCPSWWSTLRKSYCHLAVLSRLSSSLYVLWLMPPFSHFENDSIAIFLSLISPAWTSPQLLG
jgi:hypothetical protein